MRLLGQIGFFRANKVPAGYQEVSDLIAADAAFPDKLQALLTINAGFDPNMEAHHHAVCDRCGLVRDVPAEPGPRARAAAPASLEAAPGFRIRSVERIYRGRPPTH